MVSGTVWTNFERIVQALDLSYEDVAFTNLAKCALPSGSKAAHELNRIRCHEGATSLSSLIQILEPRLVIIAKDSQGANKLVKVRSSDATAIRRCNNRTFVSEGAPISDWLPLVASGW
jgi:hypothetical protein